ncbi:dihydrofolate reductase [Candidatus Woesearchaeota archaeon]|nr:dihydrofolate reductase [Candidatus Woesearchaeota archaeon]
MSQTINGYIAKENGDTPWSQEVWNSYYKIAKSFKAIILGRKTYEIMESVKEFKKIGNPFTVVVTKKAKKNEDKTFFVKNPKEAIKLLKQKGFKTALIGGGGKVNASFMKEKLIDEIILDIEPLIFGNGMKLFADNNFEAKLELSELKKLSANTIQVKYTVKK